MNSLVGIWTPKDLVLPNVPSNVDFAQYYITDSGSIEGIDIAFEAGKWLVYIKSANGQKWYQTNGVTAVDTKSPEFYPDPGFYTKVRLDNQGHIIGAEDLTEDDLPDHHHTAHSIEGIDKMITLALSKAISNNYNNAVIFNYDKKTEGLSADVRIDDYTIVKNAEGELSVNPELLTGSMGGGGDGTGNGCANHEHEISQINGFEDAIIEIIQRNGLLDTKAQNIVDLVDGSTIVINRNGQLAAVGTGGSFKEHQHEIKDIVDLDPARLEWAANQLISENADIKLDEGIEDFSKATIGDFIQYVNNYLKKVNDDVNDLLAHKGKVTPQKPKGLSNITPIDNADKIDAYDCMTLFKEVEASSMLSISLDKVSPKKGRIQIFDGDKMIGDFDTSLNDRNQQHFTITYEGDYYADDENYSGFYDCISLKYDNANLKEGAHTIYAKHKYDDVEEVSKPLFVNIYQKDRKFSLDSVKLDVANDKYVSGIPCYEKDLIFVVTPLIGNVERFIPKKCISYNGECLLPDAYSAGKKQVAFDSIKKLISKTTCQAEATYRCRNFNGVEEEFTTYSNYVRYDSSWVESYRVKIDHDPRVEGRMNVNPFDNTLPFVLAQAEAPIINNIAYNNNLSYRMFKGPDYTNLRNERMNFDVGGQTSSNYYKFVELKFAIPQGMRSIKIDLVDENGDPFSKFMTGEFDKVALFACIGNETQTDGKALVGNKYWKRATSLQNNNFAALDLYRSNDVTKVLTFGDKPYAYEDPYLYLILGVSSSLDIARVIQSVEESINEWR